MNEFGFMKHCWGIFEQNSIVNSVRVDDWTTQAIKFWKYLNVKPELKNFKKSHTITHNVYSRSFCQECFILPIPTRTQYISRCKALPPRSISFSFSRSFRERNGQNNRLEANLWIGAPASVENPWFATAIDLYILGAFTHAVRRCLSATSSKLD